jgi:hypothetical protein
MKMITVQEIGISNQINLCESCAENHPSCEPNSVVFGDGVGHDNICACDIYSPVKLRKTKCEDCTGWYNSCAPDDYPDYIDDPEHCEEFEPREDKQENE